MSDQRDRRDPERPERDNRALERWEHPDDRRNTVKVIATRDGSGDDTDSIHQLIRQFDNAADNADADEWLTRPQVAAMLGISISALSKRVRKGRDENGVCAPPSYKYPGHPNGTKRRWRKSDVLKWIERQRKGE